MVPMPLFEKPAEVREVVATDPSRARALADPVRTALLQLLSHRPMSVEEMTRELARLGLRKASTTVRHHVDVLKEAGLIDLVRVEEAGGGMLKYYAATTRVLEYELPETFEQELGPAVEEAAADLEEWTRGFLRKHGAHLHRVAEGMRECEHCNVQHFKEYLILRVLQRALAGAVQGERVQKLLRGRS